MKNLNKQQEELLERMFAGEVVPDDESQLLRNYADPNFKDELRFQLSLRKALRREHARSPLKRELEQIGKRLAWQRKVRWMALAASVALVAIVLVLPGTRQEMASWFNPKPIEKTDVPSIAALVKMPRDLAQAGTIQDTTEQLYRSAKTAFTKKNYKSAISLLEKIDANSNYYVVARFLLGHCYLIDNQKPLEAVVIFEDFIQKGSGQLLRDEYAYDIDKLKWNRMLALKAAKQTTAYLAALQEFTKDQTSPFYKEALMLMENDF